MLLFFQAIQIISLTKDWLYHQDIQESELSEEIRFLKSIIIIIVYHILQTLTLLESMQLICFMLSVEIFLMQINHVLQRYLYATLFLIRQHNSIILY